MTQDKIIQVMVDMIDMPNHKLLHVINHSSLINGIWSTLKKYNIPHTEENHNMLVELVEDKLMDGSDMEREWSEYEYENFVKYGAQVVG